MSVALEKEKSTTRTWSRVVRFSLRTLFLLTLIAALIVGWVGSAIGVARRNEATAQILRDSGVVLRYIFKPKTNLVPANEWTRKVFGRQFFDQVSEMWTPEFETAKIVNQVQFFPHLQKAIFNGTEANDETFKHLQGCADLSVLYAGGTKITDAGLTHIGNLKSLKQLVLWDTRVGDEGIAALGNLPSLWILYIQDTDITNQAIRSLYDSPLRLRIQELNISGTSITAAALPLLAQFKSLQFLSLKDVSIDAEKFLVLAQLPKLKRLRVSGLNAAEVEELRRAFPKKCIIHCSDMVVATPED